MNKNNIYLTKITSAIISAIPIQSVAPVLPQQNLETILSPTYERPIPFDLNKDYNSGAVIRRVSLSQLPEGVLGFYNPSSHTITVASDQSNYVERFVTEHESGHARGLIDEQRTDNYATSITGYNLRQIASQPLVLKK